MYSYEEWDITCLASCVDKSTQGKLFVTLRFSFCLDKTDSNSYLHNDWVRDIAFSHPLPWSHLRGVGPLGKELSLVACCLRPGERQTSLSEQNCGTQPTLAAVESRSRPRRPTACAWSLTVISQARSRPLEQGDGRAWALPAGWGGSPWEHAGSWRMSARCTLMKRKMKRICSSVNQGKT